MSEQKRSSTVVTGGPGERRFFNVSLKAIFWDGKRGKITTAAVIVLIAVIVGLVLWNRHDQQKLTEVVRHQLTPQQQLTVRVNNDIAKGKYDAAIGAIKNSTLTSESTDLLLVTAYKSKGDYVSALKVYQQIITVYGLSLGMAEGAGDVAVKANDPTDAIKYYQQALQIISNEKTNPLSNVEKTSYQNLIKQLQAGELPQ